MRKIIDAKIAGQDVVAPAHEAPPKVVNLMNALRQSLERVSATKKQPARIDQARSARAAAEKAAPKRRARG